MKRLLLVVVLLGAAIAAAFYYFRPKSDDLQLAGTIEARTVDVGSLVGGRISAVLVKEGDVVVKDQPLVTFETDLLDLQIAEQRAAVAQLHAALTRTRVGPRREDREQARIDFEAAEVNRKRMLQLLQGGATSQQTYDDAAAKSAKAQEVYLAAERGGRHEDVATAGAEVAQAESHLAFLERQRRDLTVNAPAAGLVQTIDLRPGDLVAANAAVATLLEPDQIWVRVYVPEPQLALVRLGQTAAVAVDGVQGRTFPGRVVEIRTQAEYTPRNVQTLDERNDQVFGVKIEIATNQALKPGMAALVSLAPHPPPAPTAPAAVRAPASALGALTVPPPGGGAAPTASPPPATAAATATAAAPEGHP